MLEKGETNLLVPPMPCVYDADTHTHMYAHTHVDAHIRTCMKFIHTRKHANKHAYMYTYIHTCICRNIHKIQNIHASIQYENKHTSKSEHLN